MKRPNDGRVMDIRYNDGKIERKFNSGTIVQQKGMTKGVDRRIWKTTTN